MTMVHLLLSLRLTSVLANEISEESVVCKPGMAVAGF
jgi:hypothetical protein